MCGGTSQSTIAGQGGGQQQPAVTRRPRGRRSRHHRSDLRDGLLGQAEADPLLDSAPLGLLGDQDRPLVVVRHPDWSEQGAAGAVPWIRVLQL